MNAEQLTTLTTAALADMKAQNVLALDVTEMTSIADRIVVASGTSSRHVKSLANNVVEHAKAAGVQPLGVEGDQDAEWVLIDLGDVVVHVMTPATRQYYDLERLWSVGPQIKPAAAQPADPAIAKQRSKP